MQLKVFLLIGFVLNAFCLNNLNGGFLNPKYDLRKKESLLESLKDPSSFVELFAEADSDKINEVITLLEALKGEASSALEILVSHVTNAGNALDIANDNVVIAINNADDADNNQRTAQTRVDEVNTEHDRALIVLSDAQHDQQSADVAKSLADTNYAEQSPGFIDEQGVLRQAINLLAGLNGTHPPTASPTASPTATPTASPTATPTNGDSYLFDTRNIDGCGCKMSDNSYPATAWYYLNNFNEQVLMEFCQARCNEMDSCEAIALKIPQSICHIYFINGLWPARPNSFNVVSNGVVGGWTKGIRNNCEGANNGCYYKSNLGPCASGNDAVAYAVANEVAACEGSFSGNISASTLCSEGWHVCNGRDIYSHYQITAAMAQQIPRCFAYDSMNDCSGCWEHCEDNAVELKSGCLDSGAGHDLTGMGSGCSVSPSDPACIQDIRSNIVGYDRSGCVVNSVPSGGGVMCCIGSS